MEEVLKVLRQLEVMKSPGLDRIHPSFLREVHTCETIAYPLKRLFSHSIKCHLHLMNGRKQRLAHYSKRDKCVAGYYRPVSLKSMVYKIFQKFVRSHVMNHMKMIDSFTNKQYGFITDLQLYNY